MPNAATVSYGDKTYTVTIDVQPAAGEDGMPTTSPPPEPVAEPASGAEDQEYPDDFEPVEGSSTKGGRKPRRTNRRGPGRPRKTRRYRRRSIRK